MSVLLGYSPAVAFHSSDSPHKAIAQSPTQLKEQPTCTHGSSQKQSEAHPARCERRLRKGAVEDGSGRGRWRGLLTIDARSLRPPRKSALPSTRVKLQPVMLMFVV